MTAPVEPVPVALTMAGITNGVGVAALSANVPANSYWVALVLLTHETKTLPLLELVRVKPVGVAGGASVQVRETVTLTVPEIVEV